jgi:hypothetical protein
MNYKTINQNFNNFLINIQNLFNQESNETLFQQRNTIKIVKLEQKEYVVKSFKVPHLLNQIVYKFFRASKAQRSYENAVKLVALNINTPQPIGYIEFPSTFLFKESYYVSDLFDYDFEIRALLADESFPQREEILKEFVAFSFDLHNKGVFHVDYSPGNVLVKKVNESYIFSLIDVNRMQFIEFTDELRMKAFAKLSALDGDRKFIVKEYCQLANMELDFATSKMEFFHQEHQQYIEKKKKLRKLKKRKS